MAQILTLPALGQSVEEVRLLRWCKKPGESVVQGEVLAEIETDKAALEWESPASGTIRALLIDEGAYASINAPAVELGEVSAPLSPRARSAADELGVEPSALAGVVGSGPGGRVLEKDVLALHMAGRGPKVSPLARAVASEAGVAVETIAGSGEGGRVVAGDVRQAVEPGRRVPLTGLRRAIASNLSRSVREKPHVTLQLEADMSEALRLKERLAAESRLSITDLVIWASARALREHSHLNVHIDDEGITRFDAVHIGLAVSLGTDGLIVPVIHDAHLKGLAALASERVRLAEAARAGKLDADALSGATFTVTNLGPYGIEAFNPIIPPPQAAILGVNAIVERVVVVDGAPAVRPRMNLSLSFDHRAVDGAPAAAFLARIKTLLEDPARGLL